MLVELVHILIIDVTMPAILENSLTHFYSLDKMSDVRALVVTRVTIDTV